jgi:hypothetical protein
MNPILDTPNVLYVFYMHYKTFRQNPEVIQPNLTSKTVLSSSDDNDSVNESFVKVQ